MHIEFAGLRGAPLLRFAQFTSRFLLGFVLFSAALSRGDARSPAIVPLNAAQLWQRVEFRVDATPSASNCFDPDVIALDATFTTPSGRKLTIPAFWFQDYTRALIQGTEVLTPLGPPQWRIRFTPAEAGDHTLSLSVRTNCAPAGEPVIARFNVPTTPAPAGQHGFVRVAPDQRYFQTGDGRYLRLIGQNVCWAETQGTFDYDAWFGGMRSAGENFARLWLAPWFMPLEHKPGTLNRYDLPGAWQLDYIFEKAEKDGIYIVLAFDHHGMYQVDNPNWGGSNNFWKSSNPYSKENGGPCAKPNDFFTDNTARATYRKFLRYLIGRYGYSPNLLSWQFFNEIDNVFGPLNGDDVIAWHREMGQWLRAQDAFAHLISTSLTGGSERPEFWVLPELDFTVYHSYFESAPGRNAAALARSFVDRYRKPMMIGEFGIDARSWNIAADPHLRGFRQALWGGALGGSVGTAMPWWWQDMHTDDVYPLLAVMNQLLTRGGWQQGVWTPAEFSGAGGTAPDELGDVIRDGQLFNPQLPMNTGWRLTRKLSGALAISGPLSAERAAEKLSAYLLGTKDAEFQRPLRLTAHFGEKGRLSFRVKSVYTSAELTVKVDGAEVLRTNFTMPQSSTRLRRDIIQDFAFDLPAGKRVIEIANPKGEDWVMLEALKLEQVRPASFPGGWEFPPEVVGLRSERKAILYAYSPFVVFPTGALRYNPPVQTRSSVTLARWPAGKFRARWFDPRTGQSAGTTDCESDGGGLSLAMPAFRDDLAAIVESIP